MRNIFHLRKPQAIWELFGTQEPSEGTESASVVATPDTRTRRFMTLVSKCALVIVATLLLPACTSERRSAALIGESNVVVIVIDTLRADHLPFYGYEKDTAPFLRSIADKGVVFERAIAGCSSTGPAMATVFTSLYPSQHGLITGVLATQRLVKVNPSIRINRIPEQLKTLGQYFKEAGYRTFGVADNLNISEQQGFTKGFDKFATYRYNGAATVNKTLWEWAPEIMAGGKYFLYVHYMDPHAPHFRRKPWFEKGATREQSILNAYDSEIRYTDEHIRALFEKFNLQENTLVLVLADHGEEFGDHGGSGHGKTLYREVIHVPYVLYHPALPPRRVSEFVHTIDTVPTLAELVGIAKEPHWVGVSLAPLAKGMPAKNLDLDGRPVFSQLLRRPEHEKDPKESVVHQRHHLIVTPKREGGGAREELYHLDTDFSEQRDLASEMPEVTVNIGKNFADLHDESKRVKAEEIEIPLDDEAIKSLKTLGYLE